MLARITGTLESLEGNRALVMPEGQRGVGYEVLVPAYLARSLAAGMEGAGEGGGVTLHTLQYFESLNQGASFVPRLIGFASGREREFFELLTSVKGLGNKRALRAMSVEPGAIARAIAERDGRFLQSLPEIGPKLADLIVHELKSKVDGFVGVGSRVDAPPPSPRVEVEPKSKGKKSAGGNGVSESRKVRGGAEKATAGDRRGTQEIRPPVRETVDALIALGETPVDAERMVARAVDRARSSGEGLPTNSGELLTLAYAAR